jgi:hypothetical protein
MIKIRQEQIDAFIPQDDESIIDFLIEHLNDEHYDYISDMPSSTLREMVANGLTRARSHGFTELELITRKMMVNHLPMTMWLLSLIVLTNSLIPLLK